MLRSVIPENRARAYDVRTVIEVLADADSVLELRREFGASAVTALARIDGETVGIIANDPTRLAGAIDSDAADKLARFLHLCDVFSVPVVSLCDTPGIMVGPQAEETATIRHSARLFIATAELRVPFFCVVLRRACGLGAQADGGGQRPRAGVHGGVADRRVRQHGIRGAGQARIPERARQHRRRR